MPFRRRRLSAAVAVYFDTIFDAALRRLFSPATDTLYAIFADAADAIISIDCDFFRDAAFDFLSCREWSAAGRHSAAANGTRLAAAFVCYAIFDAA